MASVRSGCTGDGGDHILRHFVDRIDLDTWSVDRLSEGELAAVVAKGPDGSLYLQVGESLVRYGKAGALDPEAIMPGILLLPPEDGMDCGI